MIPEILKKYPTLYKWVESVVHLTKPDKVSIFLDPIKDDEHYTQILIKNKVLIPLINPNCYYITTDPDDTARVEESTFICTETKEQAGITNNWKDPHEMKEHLKKLFSGCMEGREMIIIPYCMGPLDSPYKVIGVEITDSMYVAISMRRMARCGSEVLELLKDHPYVPGLHSVGVPLKKGEKDRHWPCNPKERIIAHFPKSYEIFSYGSGYGGNALLGKKCLALRMASYMGYEKGFLAEHMLIMGLTNPQGEKKYILASFPSSCGKTNLAMLEPLIPGWKVSVVGDDIAWIHIDKEGNWRAINPEFGFFGVAPGTSWKSNPQAMRMIQKDTLFTNTGYSPKGVVYWEGMEEKPEPLMTWKNKPYDGTEKAAHPNSRFTTPLENCDRLDPEYQNPQGVKIEAIIFGGRRSEGVGLVTESFNFNHGVFLASTLSSETTAASVGETGKVRTDPFAMLPFCGYNMAHYFKHWIEMGKKSHPPKIFLVNWFRKKGTSYVWPGFSENLRVLKWILERCKGHHHGIKTSYGIIPEKSELDLKGLSVDYSDLFDSDKKVLDNEKVRQKEFLEKFGKDLPKELKSNI